MRTECRLIAAAALLIPLSGLSCSSESQPFPSQPIPAALTDRQAAVLAHDYLREHAVPTTGLIAAEERESDGWRLYYETAFDASARPPSLAYVLRVRDDGTVDQVP